MGRIELISSHECFQKGKSIKFKHSFLPPVILAGTLLSFYLRTIAPDFSWANGGVDGGDLIAAAATGGIAHPTGYPLYLLLARLFQSLPVGSLAYRTNLMSTLATVFATVLVYTIVTSSVSTIKSIPTMLAGIVAGLCFGLAPLVWSQAVITEVYSLQSFLIVTIIYLYSLPFNQSKSIDRWRGLVMGLAMGNHITTILLIPMALLIGSITNQRNSKQHHLMDIFYHRSIQFDGDSLRTQLSWFGLGLCVYILVPIWAFAQPPINWGNPVSFEKFWWLLSGSLYQRAYLNTNIPNLWIQIKAWVTILLEQAGAIGIGIGLIGLVVFGKLSRLYILTVWAAAISLCFTLVYRSADANVYLIPMFISFSIWIGLSTGRLAMQFSQHFSIIGVGIGLLLIVYFIIRSLSYIDQVDASQDHRAEVFGSEVLSTVPENAIVFAEGDQAVFTLWYYHFALGERRDLVVIATDLLHFDWYQETMEAEYPSLVLPGPFRWPETITLANPSRHTCYVQYTGHTEIECTEPLTILSKYKIESLH